MKCCINDVNFIRLLLLNTELFKFEFQNMVKFYVYIRKPYFLIPGHIKNFVFEYPNIRLFCRM